MQRRERQLSFLLLLPSLIALGLFVYGFIAWTGLVSFSNWKGLIPDFSFAGFKNYLDLFGIERFQNDLKNTVIFTFLFLIASLGIGLLLAILIDRKIRFESLWRNLFLFPMALSFVVTGTVWRWIFNPQSGINEIFHSLGLGFIKIDWLIDEKLAIYAVIIAAVWQMSGFAMAMYLAGLRSIPEEVREAARVDGASEFQMYTKVILPLLNPITLSAVIILGHISLKIFDLIFVMTKGGPGFATDMPGVYMFDATFGRDLYARGAAIAMIMLVLVALVIIPYLISNRRRSLEA